MELTAYSDHSGFVTVLLREYVCFDQNAWQLLPCNSLECWLAERSISVEIQWYQLWTGGNARIILHNCRPEQLVEFQLTWQ